MRLWRLTRPEFVALDGEGAVRYGGRYSPVGHPMVPLASEAGLAVLISLRYVEPTPAAYAQPYLLGWTDVDAVPERVPDAADDADKRAFVAQWAAERRSLLAAVRSAVLPEADVVLFNPLHPDAAHVAPLTTRPFTFGECLHRPPMLDHFAPAEK